MFAFDLPFLFIAGIILGILVENNYITKKTGWILSIGLLFIFQAGGIMLWYDVLPGSKEFMIIPFDILDLTTDDFEPVLSSVLFALEPLLMILGVFVGVKSVGAKKN